jgi:acyl-CoA reductase-like NAD-dependent aldehyde dehydrogenase
VAKRIRTGVVEVNGKPVGWQAPVGGVKYSGVGREAGLEGFEGYNEPKSYGISAELADEYSQRLAGLPGENHS